jgi:DNA replication protein DnaC
MGMRIVERADGYPLAELCDCRVERRNAELLRRARIPEHFKPCTLENYRYDYKDAHPSLYNAFNQARKFVQDYFLQPRGVGLLFTGTVGTGKTHLAVGLLKALVLQKGVRALFCDQAELLKAVGNSYNRSVSTTEMEVLKPVLEAELLVIDELGRFKKSDWVSDIVEHVLNTRYNENLTTIITTNFPDRASGQAAADPQPDEREEPRSIVSTEQDRSFGFQSIDTILDRRDILEGRKVATAAEKVDSQTTPRLRFTQQSSSLAPKADAYPPRKLTGARSEETLGDRIGERMRSRLSEMCVTVEMTGADYRRGAKKAHFQ